MATTAEATAAPVPITIGKKTYLVSPLRDTDYGVLEKFAQDRYMALAIRSAEQIDDIEVKKSLINRAYDTASKVTFSSPEGIQQLATPQGMVMLIWVSLRKEHPDLSVDDIADMLTQEDNAMKLSQAVERQSKKKTKRKKTPKGPIPTRRQT